MTGEITPGSAVLVGTLSSTKTLSGVLSAAQTMSGVLAAAEAAPLYEGTYDVTPAPFQDIVLDTNGRRLANDITVREIPYYTTTNLSGGYTAIIGG